MNVVDRFKKKVAKKDYFDEPTDEMIDYIMEKGRIQIRPQRTASTSISQMIGGDNRHMGAFMYKRKMGEDFDHVFKFSISRNPYTRFASSYNAFAKDPRDINQYLEEEGMERLMRVRFFSFLPQHTYMYEDGERLVDYVGRFEELGKAWDYISKKLGIDKKLPHVGKTRPVKLTDKSKEMIYPFYEEDFRLFNYER